MLREFQKAFLVLTAARSSFEYGPFRHIFTPASLVFEKPTTYLAQHFPDPLVATQYTPLGTNHAEKRLEPCQHSAREIRKKVCVPGDGNPFGRMGPPLSS